MAQQPTYLRDEDALAQREFTRSLLRSLLEQQESALADELSLSAIVLSWSPPE